MKQITISRYLHDLGAKAPVSYADEVCAKISSLTAARFDVPSSTTYISNPRRLHLISAVLAECNGQDLLEIGAGRGYCTIGVVLVARLLGRDMKVLSFDVIDPAQKQAWGQRDDAGRWVVQPRSLRETLSYYGCTDDVTIVHGLSCKVLKNLVPPHAYSVIFIDGCHTFWNVSYDLLKSITLLKAGGRIVMDDFGGSQGAATKIVVGLLRRIGVIDVVVINMEPPQNGPAVEFDHCMAVVRPTDGFTRWLDSFAGKVFVGIVRKFAELEIGLNWLRQLTANFLRRLTR